MLKLIPEIDSVFIYSRGTVDSWGITSKGDAKKEIKGRIKEAENSSPVESQSGKQVIPTHEISINGDVGIVVGDKVEVFGNVLTILTRQPKKDLSGKTIYVKYKV